MCLLPSVLWKATTGRHWAHSCNFGQNVKQVELGKAANTSTNLIHYPAEGGETALGPSTQYAIPLALQSLVSCPHTTSAILLSKSNLSLLLRLRHDTAHSISSGGRSYTKVLEWADPLDGIVDPTYIKICFLVRCAQYSLHFDVLRWGCHLWVHQCNLKRSIYSLYCKLGMTWAWRGWGWWMVGVSVFVYTCGCGHLCGCGCGCERE